MIRKKNNIRAKEIFWANILSKKILEENNLFKRLYLIKQNQTTNNTMQAI